MKLVTTSLAVSAIVLSLSGAVMAQTSLDPNAQGSAQGKSRGSVGVPPSEGQSGMSGGAAGAATTGAGVRSKSGAGAGGDVSGSGSAGGSIGTGGAGTGASGKARGNTLGN
jgi:hypothetical protein